MKELINIGAVVDDGTGDYLRKGGLKINGNFDNLFYQLGDGEQPHAAGAWKTWSVLNDGTTINAEWGKSYAIDTTSAPATFVLPKGDSTKYNFVIRARDVFGTWQRNGVTLVPALGDTLKGSPDPRSVTRNLADLELVYCAPGRWEWVDNKQVDRITSDNIATVVNKSFIATEGQTDWLDVLNGYSYNVSNTLVYHRGNLLFYSGPNGWSADDAEVGSPGAAPGEIVQFNGKDIRLKNAAVAGDTVIVISYLDGITQWRSSYNRAKAVVLDSRLTDKESIPGSQLVIDLSTPRNSITTLELGLNTGAPINPNSLQVYLNSTLLNEVGTLGQDTFRCEGGVGGDQASCTLNGGTWVASNEDYSLIETDGIITQIDFGRNFENGDVVNLVWFNNDIGTLLGMDEIKDELDDRYVSSGPEIKITGQVRLTDYDHIGAPNVEPVPEYNVSLSSSLAIMNTLYPVGTIYENGVNPNNPATYLGFGTWKLFGQGRVLTGWSSDPADTDFGLNNNDLDVSGNPSHTAGGTGGNRNVNLVNVNLPETKTDDKVLIEDANGPIIVGGCQLDPDAQGPAYNKYREDYASTNKAHGASGPTAVNVLSPYVTVYRWIRIL